MPVSGLKRPSFLFSSSNRQRLARITSGITSQTLFIGTENSMFVSVTAFGNRIVIATTAAEALNGQTPSEAAGIKVEGENRWITLIQNASKKEQEMG
jgi:hypothetical protein